MSGESIRQRDKRPHQRAKDKRLLDETKVNDTRDMEKDRLGVRRKGNEQNSHQPQTMGSQIRSRSLRNRKKYVSLEVPNVLNMPKMQRQR